MDREEVQKEFVKFCNKWEINHLDYEVPTYTLNALEQAFHSGCQFGGNKMVVDDKKSKDLALEMLSKGVSCISVRNIEYKDKKYTLISETKEQEE